MRSRPSSRSPEDGFTLLELVVVTAITGIVVAVLGTFFATQYRVYLRQKTEIELEEDLRTALGFLVRELRVAGFSLDPDQDSGAGDFAPRLLPGQIVWTNSYSGQSISLPSNGAFPDEGRREISFFDVGILRFIRGDIETLLEGIQELSVRHLVADDDLDCTARYTAGQSAHTVTCQSLPLRETTSRIELRLTAVRSVPGGEIRRSLIGAATLRNSS